VFILMFAAGMCCGRNYSRRRPPMIVFVTGLRLYEQEGMPGRIGERKPSHVSQRYSHGIQARKAAMNESILAQSTSRF
jgi:hypothetical protein